MIARWLCGHDYKYTHREVIVACLGWDMRATRQFTYHHECIKCGKTMVEEGMVCYGDRLLNKDKYNGIGWPVDDSGKELPIV